MAAQTPVKPGAVPATTQPPDTDGRTCRVGAGPLDPGQLWRALTPPDGCSTSCRYWRSARWRTDCTEAPRGQAALTTRTTAVRNSATPMPAKT